MYDDKLHLILNRIDIHWIYINNNEQIKCESSNEDYETIFKLYSYCKKKGFKIKKAILKGPCYAENSENLTLDENLNTYYCQGFLYDRINVHGLNQNAKTMIFMKNIYYAI